MSDLERFYSKWTAEAEEFSQKNFVIHYSELVSSPKTTINSIKRQFNLPISEKVYLAKERYSRAPALVDWLKRQYQCLKSHTAEHARLHEVLSTVKGWLNSGK